MCIRDRSRETVFCFITGQMCLSILRTAKPVFCSESSAKKPMFTYLFHGYCLFYYVMENYSLPLLPCVFLIVTLSPSFSIYLSLSTHVALFLIKDTSVITSLVVILLRTTFISFYCLSSLITVLIQLLPR